MISRLTEDSRLTAEIRRILNRLQLLDEKSNRPTSLMVTSAMPREGKSVLSLALALAMAGEMKEKLLLVDANWGNPGIHRWLDLKQHGSRREQLSDPLDVVQSSGVTNLDVLTAPKAVDKEPRSENISAEAITALMDKLNRNYAQILIDTAPVQPNRGILDPLLLAPLVQCVLLVVLTRSSKRQEVKRAKFALQWNQENVLAVLNNYKNPFYT